MDWQPLNLKLADYEPIIGSQQVDLIHRLADMVQNRRLLHLNSTRMGGGVAEILTRLVPLMRDVGLDAEWAVIRGDEDFFHVTKAFHNALHGLPALITRPMLDTWYSYNQLNMQEIDTESADFIVAHDPQPAAFVESRRAHQKWIWRCHIDVSHPDAKLWKYLSTFVGKYDAAVFSMSHFARRLPIRELLIQPSIDPLSEKNIPLPEAEIDAAYARFSVPRDRPVLLQISRFDRLKDPLGVLQAYQLVKRHHDCVLVLAGGTAADDPEGAKVLAEVREYAQSDADIHILLLPHEDRLVNALQRGATIIFQKSLKEGFGLTVSEALWKGKPVIGGNAGGIPMQVHNRHTGYLVSSVEGAAYWARFLLEHPEVRRHMGELGRELVRRSFLITRNLRDYLTMLVMLESSARGLHHL